MNQPTPPTTASQPVRKEGADRLSVALTAALCTLLGVNLMVTAFSKPGPASASAQVGGYTNGGLVNALPPTGVVPAPENIPSAPTSPVEMMKRVIEQQIETNARLARIEGQMSNPHQVTVTNWPANIAQPAAPAGK